MVEGKSLTPEIGLDQSSDVQGQPDSAPSLPGYYNQRLFVSPLKETCVMYSAIVLSVRIALAGAMLIWLSVHALKKLVFVWWHYGLSVVAL